MYVILYLEINKTEQQPFFLKESDFFWVLVVLVGWLYYFSVLEPLYKTVYLRCRKTWSNIPSTMAQTKFLTDVV